MIRKTIVSEECLLSYNWFEGWSSSDSWPQGERNSSNWSQSPGFLRDSTLTHLSEYSTSWRYGRHSSWIWSNNS